MQSRCRERINERIELHDGIKTYTISELSRKFNIKSNRILQWLHRGHIEGEKDKEGKWQILETEIPTFIRKIKGWELLTGENK